jgi:arsenate reductase
MAEAGVDISGQESQHLDEFGDIEFDYVITLCDNAAQRCPVFSGKAKVIHRPFTDPYFAEGTDEEVMAEFREVREEIKRFIESMPENLENIK